MAVDIGERLLIRVTTLKPPSSASTFHGAGNRRTDKEYTSRQRNKKGPDAGGVKLFQDNGGNMTVSLTSRAAGEASPSASPTTSASSPAPMNDVAAAQQRLKDRGYYAGPVDGAMGPRTTAALRAYQRDHGLSVTGRLDSPTASALVSEPSMTAASAADIRTAQRQLKDRGYYAGPVDGVLGAGHGERASHISARPRLDRDGAPRLTDRPQSDRLRRSRRR